MAPSPAAGKKEEPQTPTKIGKNPQSSSTTKLNSKDASKGTTPTPRKPPKLGASKATPKSTSSPKLPPRPKVEEVTKDTSDKVESEEDKPQGIDLKDNDPSETAEDISGKQAGNDTGAESTSVADTSELSEANPDPVEDSEEESTVSGARDTIDDAAQDEGTETEGGDAAEEAEDEGESGALGGIKSAAGSVGKTATGAATRTKDTVGKVAGKASEGDVNGVVKDVKGDVEENADETAKDVKEAGDDVEDDVEDTTDEVTDKAPAPVSDTKKDADDAVSETEEKVDDNVEEAEAISKDTTEEVESKTKDATDEAESKTKDTTDDLEDEAESKAKDTTDDIGDEAEDTVEDAKAKTENVTEEAEEKVDDTKDAAEDKLEGAKDKTKDGVDESTEEVKDSTNVADADADADEPVSDLKEKAQDKAEDVKKDAEDEVDDTKDQAEGAVDDTKDQVPDLSLLKGLKVNEKGEIANKDGKVIGKLEEGDPEDLEGYEVGDDGEILDEDGDVIGRAELIPDDAKDQVEDVAEDTKDAADGVEDTADDAAEDATDEVKTYMPDIDVLKGLEVQENGDILDSDGNVLGKISEGDPADLVGMTLNEEGEILDEDGDVVGRAEVVPQEIKEEAEDAKGELPGLDVLDGLEVGEDGEIKDASGNTLAKITEGDPADLVGRTVNAEGEVLDEEGDVIGRAEIVPEAAEAVEDTKDAAEETSPELEKLQEIQEQLKPNLDIVEGKKLNKKGNIIDEEGEILAKLVEGDPKACAGKVLNENGEITDDEGNVIGRVEVVSGEAADVAMQEIHPELVEQLEEAQKAADEAEKQAEEAEEQAEEAGESADVAEEAADKAEDAKDAAEDAADKAGMPDFSMLDGLKVNKKGEVLNEDGEPIARLSEGELGDVRGKKINDKGEILNRDGDVIGKVEFIPEAIEEGLVETIEETPEEPEEPETSILEGLKVNKKGEVLNEDGEVIAKLSSGELEKVAGKKLNDKGEIVDKDGNVLGKVEMVSQKEEVEEEKPEEESVEDTDDGLPPLSILEGLKVNKAGKLVDNNGNIVGELSEGDAKKLWKSGSVCDAEGKFWDNRGHVIGQAKTVPREDPEGEGEFAGLEGLVVVKDGWIEDENGNRVGKIVDGDHKKLVGRAVDEDGDIIDKKGNVVGHAERYEEDEPEPEAEPEAIDLSELKGLSPNKQGNVISRDGIPVGRVVEGNVKELAGRRIGENGQIWNDGGEVIGRCELIPPQDREAKPEGPFAGLEGLVVRKDGLVENPEGTVVGKVVEGDVKKLVGRGVDEDGDIIDKQGNVKGHAEPYEIPEEEVQEEDLSSLGGKTINKQGKAVDEHGTIYGQVIEGDLKRLIGCKVDGKGQIWSNDGKVIGKAGLIQGGDDGRAEGPFSNFESTVVSKDGMVKDASGEIVGRVIEGDHKKLVGRKVDDEGDIVDKNGNVIGKAERWEPEEKQREVNAMSGLRVNKEGEVRDKNGDVIGRLTDGNLLHCIGKEINDNGYVVDQDGSKLGEVTLLENIPEEEVEEEVEEGPSEEEITKQEEREVAKKISNIISQTLDKMEPVCKQITEHIERADRTPKEELDEEKLVQDVKPLIEEGNRILGECNGAIRGLDPDGHIAAQAKARAASGEATPEEHRVAEGLKELTTQVVKTVDNAKKRISDMPHAKKKLNPLWGLLTEPLFQIIAAVGLLLSGVLGLVGKLLNGLGLGGLVNGLLGGLGVDKLLGGLGLGSITESLGLGGGKKKK